MTREGLFVCLLLLAVGGACSPSVEWMDARDRGEPLLKRARTRRSEGDIDGAIALYRQALRTEQRMALANLDLGLLLHDEKKDYLGAVTHYTRYLEARPDTDKSEMIRKRRQLALQSLVAEQAPDVRPSGVAAKASPDDETRKENTELAAALQRARKDQETAQDAVARAEELEARNVELESVVRRLENEMAELKIVHATALTAAPARTDRAAARPGKRTYEVMPGDSLSSIAAGVYGDGSKWRTLYDANRDTLGNSQTVKVGQILTVP